MVLKTSLGTTNKTATSAEENHPNEQETATLIDPHDQRNPRIGGMCCTVAAGVAAGAGGTVDRSRTAETALTPEVLANMTYQSEYGEDGTVTLVDGSYSAPAAPGSASMNTVDLLPEYTVFGDLDGVPSAVVVLVSSGGGSGTFYNLPSSKKQDGQPVNVAAYALGDRIKLNSVAIENNQIVVDMIAAGESDPACCPTHHYVNTYELQGDQIVEIGQPDAWCYYT